MLCFTHKKKFLYLGSIGSLCYGLYLGVTTFESQEYKWFKESKASLCQISSSQATGSICNYGVNNNKTGGIFITTGTAPNCGNNILTLHDNSCPQQPYQPGQNIDCWLRCDIKQFTKEKPPNPSHFDPLALIISSCILLFCCVCGPCFFMCI